MRVAPQAEAVHGKALGERSELDPPHRTRSHPEERLHDGGRPRPARARNRFPLRNSSPSGPVLRANPFPEVTDLICRLPLPTLFYRLEAVHLGDLLRIWVRPGTRFTSVSLGFSRVDGSAPDTARPAVLYGYNVPISGQADSREFVPYKEKRTLPGTPADVSEFVCVAALDPLLRGSISVLGFGNINPIPFR